MDEKENRMAALANAVMFEKQDATAYIGGTPHLKHPSLRALHEDLTMRVFTSAKSNSDTPTILDLGAGAGSATIRFLELGARVTAVDLSESQLRDLRRKCARVMAAAPRYSEKLCRSHYFDQFRPGSLAHAEISR